MQNKQENSLSYFNKEYVLWLKWSCLVYIIIKIAKKDDMQIL